MIERWAQQTTWGDPVEVEVVAEAEVAAVAEGEAVQVGSQRWHPLKGNQGEMNPSATVVGG